MSEAAPLDFTTGNLNEDLTLKDQEAIAEALLQRAETEEELAAVNHLNAYLQRALSIEEECHDIVPDGYRYPNNVLCPLRIAPGTNYPKYPYPPAPEKVIRTLYNAHYGFAVSLQNAAEEKALAEAEMRRTGGPQEIVGADGALVEAAVDKEKRVLEYGKWRPNWMFWGGLALTGWGLYGKYRRK